MSEWRQIIPVERGDLVRIEINGKGQLYRSRRSVRHIGNLRLRDLVADPEADATEFLLKCMKGGDA